MNVAQVIAEVLKREGIKNLLAYPLNPLTETCAAAGIRPIIVRQERIGVHMADAVSRLSSGDNVGIFCMQVGPGVENAFGAVAQAFSECVPMVVFPGGYTRTEAWVKPNFNSALNFQHITKAVETVNTPAALLPALRRAFSLARNGRPGPVVIEIPSDMWNEEVLGDINYKPQRRIRAAPDHRDIDAAAAALVNAKRPVIYAGQGVHYSKGWAELRQLIELLEAPITTSLEGKSAFPESHPLSLGSGGVAMPGSVHKHVHDADVIFGVGASFTLTPFGIQFPTKGKSFIHNTIDPMDLQKGIESEFPLLGDTKLALELLIAAVKDRIKKPRGLANDVAARIKQQKEEWLKSWTPLLTSESKPISPYRVIAELMKVADVPNTIITHDAGSPRDELSPFWQCETPLSYLGWGKSTQLGYGLGLALGAKLAQPEKLCINVWGDAAIGMTGMDIETGARCGLPILSILFNNYAMAMEFEVMKGSRASFKSTDISGNYADFAKSLNCHGIRVTEPAQINQALREGIAATKDGKCTLIEFITTEEKVYSKFNSAYH